MIVINSYRNILDVPDDAARNYNTSNKLIIRNVSFRYKQSTQNIINNISAEFHCGEKVAIVGENGSGKTTFISMILGLLEPKKGEISNGIGKTIAIIQDFPTYQLTIKESIELGSGKILSDEQIINILKKVGLYDNFIENLPEGVNTKIGQLEHGIELSKGQYQRLAIARLLANEEARIWILDEPMAYLDPIAEIDMYKYILELAGDRLVFFISHRLGFARLADRIIVIDNGSIIEDGKHNDLIANKKKYFEMYEMQKEWYI